MAECNEKEEMKFGDALARVYRQAEFIQDKHEAQMQLKEILQALSKFDDLCKVKTKSHDNNVNKIIAAVERLSEEIL